MKKQSIGILVGSLRRESLSKKVALYLSACLEGQFDVRFLDISQLSIYNQDLDNQTNTPQSWLDFRKAVVDADAVVFVTPEYNRSIPPVLKNALDIASRPMAENAWSKKPGAVVSVSPGSVGGFGANHHLRQVAACLNIYMMQQPEAYVGGIAGAIDEAGVSDKQTQDFLQSFASSFASWISTVT